MAAYSDGDVGSTIDINKSRCSEKCSLWLRNLPIRYLVKAIGFGQVLSLLLCGTAVTSGLLQGYGVSIPTSQNFVNYVLLAIVYTPMLACRRGDENLVPVLVERGWKYFILAIIDVEANYMVVKAYQYTTVTSVQLLDCFTIPVVLILSWLILKARYKLVHYLGVVICILGVGALVLADVLTHKHSDNASNMVLGDLLCLGGALLYGISNVGEEFVVKSFNQVEFLAFIGFFGSIISGIQVSILESDTVRKIDFTNYEIVLSLLGFGVCLFLYYTLVPIVMKFSSAATVNLSILSADFYALLFGLFLFKYQFHALYFISFAFIIIGVIVYCSKRTPTADADQENVEDNTTDKLSDEIPQLIPTVRTCTENSGNRIQTDESSDSVTERTPLNSL
ncbi:solute carrier family 35 member F2-like [Tubulanus polymorphus]|uniref:solute carrier family 35 member F2-like n=1 Tax=Tubulanus polymorphus TaxID=672921 RepID=UPI003DA599DB